MYLDTWFRADEATGDDHDTISQQSLGGRNSAFWEGFEGLQPHLTPCSLHYFLYADENVISSIPAPAATLLLPVAFRGRMNPIRLESQDKINSFYIVFFCQDIFHYSNRKVADAKKTVLCWLQFKVTYSKSCWRRHVDGAVDAWLSHTYS